MTTVGSTVLADAAPAAMVTRSAVNVASRFLEVGLRSQNAGSSSLDNIQGPLAQHADGLQRNEEVERASAGGAVA